MAKLLNRGQVFSHYVYNIIITKAKTKQNKIKNNLPLVFEGRREFLKIIFFRKKLRIKNK